MEFIPRVLQLIMKLCQMFIFSLTQWWETRNEPRITVPPIRNELLTWPLMKVVNKIRKRELKCRYLVEAYIERINEVDPLINAVNEQRFEDAVRDAQRADELIARTADEDLISLFVKHPLIGVPITIKEACGVKGMSHVVGSLRRVGVRCKENGEVVATLRSAGAIILLVSANPEYCFSIETNTFTNGDCVNPYDLKRTAGGSSGGEGALNGAGASLFGVGSDIAGSIRIPSMFCGVFGHKPTGGLTSVRGHFPYSRDENYDTYLQVGPITRFGGDLGLIMTIMAGKNAYKLDLTSVVDTKTIKIFYALGFEGLNGLLHHPVPRDMKRAIQRSVKHFQRLGLKTERAHIRHFRNSTEISLGAIAQLRDFPYLLEYNPDCNKTLQALNEYFRSLKQKSNYTKEGLLFEILRTSNAFMIEGSVQKYQDEIPLLKAEVLKMLGPDGVLFFPTFPFPAILVDTSVSPLWAIDYTLIFNIMGLPTTHIPMGISESDGLPYGFQVIAAPYKDKLCFQIAAELEVAFGGWIPPAAHAC